MAQEALNGVGAAAGALPFKIVALDMDGTLLSPKHDITPYTLATLKKLTDLGVHVILATGRPFVDVSRTKRKLNLRADYTITSNGARVHDAVDDVLFEHNIPEDVCRELFLYFPTTYSKEEVVEEEGCDDAETMGKCLESDDDEWKRGQETKLSFASVGKPPVPPTSSVAKSLTQPPPAHSAAAASGGGSNTERCNGAAHMAAKGGNGTDDELIIVNAFRRDEWICSSACPRKAEIYKSTGYTYSVNDQMAAARSSSSIASFGYGSSPVKPSPVSPGAFGASPPVTNAHFTVEDFVSLPTDNISEIFFLCYNYDKIMALEREVTEKFGSKIRAAPSALHCLDIIPANVSKGSSLKTVAELLGCRIEEDCIAFGDGMNDVEMLRMVKKGLIMGNGNKRLKALLSDHEVIETNAEDGVARYLRKVFHLPLDGIDLP